MPAQGTATKGSSRHVIVERALATKGPSTHVILEGASATGGPSRHVILEGALGPLKTPNMTWRRRCLPVVAALLAALMLDAAQAQQARMPASVIGVVDGDTVDVRFDDGSTERLRLIGIDTPEVVDPRTIVQCFGREASAHAHELLDGQSVEIETDPSQGSRDRYGRLLAYIWLPDGRNFGEVMIGDGYAHEYTFRRPYAYRDDFRAAQFAALSQQLGLWSPETCAGNTTQPADIAAGRPVPQPAAPREQPPDTPGFDPTHYLGQGNRFNCADFASQADAQAVLRADPTDPNQLDSDRDGVACESNRAPRDLTPVPRP